MRSARSGRTRRRWPAVVLLLALVAGACAGPAQDPGAAPSNVLHPTVEVEVFFTNDQLGDPCTEVFAVPRTVHRDELLTGTLQALLAGPTAAEQADGYDGGFAEATADALLDVHLDDHGTVHVAFTDLRELLPDASSSCGSSALLTMLDTTLLALDGVTATRYALADQTAFYTWLQHDDPDVPAEPTEEPVESVPTEPDEPAAAPPDEADRPTYDPDAGWALISDFEWPVQPGCCSMNTVGPVSPEGPIPARGWPEDGVYDVTVNRDDTDVTALRLFLRRWVRCDQLPEDRCSPDPEPDPVTGEDPRIIGDPASEVQRPVPIEALRVVLIPLHDEAWTGGQRALEGQPGAFARLLTDGIDPAWRRWVYEPYLDGASPSTISSDLAARSADPTFPFGLDHCAEVAGCSPLGYRGPLGTSLLADPVWSSWTDAGRWPPGQNGLYGWTTVTLEVRDEQPILYLWAGPIAG
jgi:hypothetical protein